MAEYALATEEDGRVFIAAIRGYSDVTSLKIALTDLFPSCGIIGLHNVVCLHQIQFAALRASKSFTRGSMKTTRFSDEILYNLSPSSKITDAIAQFAVRADSTECAIVCTSTDTAVFSTLSAFLHGYDRNIQTIELQLTPPSADKYTEWMKMYKLTTAELQVSSFDEAVLNKLAVKDFVK